MYEKLQGGYIDARYSMEDREQWSYTSTGTSTAAVVTAPRVHGSRSLGFYLQANDVVTATTPMDTEFADASGVALFTYVSDDTANVSATLRLYTDPASSTSPSWFEFTWLPIAPTGGFFHYDEAGAVYGTAVYGSDEGVLPNDWTVLTIPKDSFTTYGTPNWSRIRQATLVVTADSPISAFFDGLSAWTQLTDLDCAANQMISRLPEYHYDQNFNDALAEAVGYPLDALVASIDDIAPAVAGRTLEVWESVMNLPVAPRGLSVEQRRGIVLALLSRAQTADELAAALTLGVGVPVRVVPNYAAYTIDIYAPLSASDSTLTLRLQMLTERLRPAHLGATYTFATSSVGANGQLPSNLVAGQYLLPTLITQTERATLADDSAVVS